MTRFLEIGSHVKVVGDTHGDGVHWKRPHGSSAVSSNYTASDEAHTWVLEPLPFHGLQGACEPLIYEFSFFCSNGVRLHQFGPCFQ